MVMLVVALFLPGGEQCTAVELKQTQALVNWGKICEANIPLDIHTLVKFFRRRIPCRCLDKKYEQVKGFKKLGHCYNPECTINCGQVNVAKHFIAVDVDV
mmetsp:Transcript_16030/g.24815  ORF Transcript_16030/g.24815 Transcript_16030/m.24815 type:complete len:100 (+) Transcript_16030:516-815(+)